MTGQPRPWGTSGRVTLTRRPGRGLVVDVRVDEAGVGVVWRAGGVGWRAAHRDPVEGLSDAVYTTTRNDAVRSVLRRVRPELAEEGL